MAGGNAGYKRVLTLWFGCPSDRLVAFFLGNCFFERETVWSRNINPNDSFGATNTVHRQPFAGDDDALGMCSRSFPFARRGFKRMEIPKSSALW